MSNEPRLAEKSLCMAHVLTTDGDSIHGWVCGKPGLLHYVYVPTELRNSGIGSALVLGQSGVRPQYSRESDWLKLKIKGTYNPYRLTEI